MAIGDHTTALLELLRDAVNDEAAGDSLASRITDLGPPPRLRAARSPGRCSR
jgi:hypothetical protein